MTVGGILSMIGILSFYAVCIGLVIYQIFHPKNGSRRDKSSVKK